MLLLLFAMPRISFAYISPPRFIILPPPMSRRCAMVYAASADTFLLMLAPMRHF